MARVSIASRKSPILLPELLGRMTGGLGKKGEKIILAFNGAQLLSGSGINFPALLAHAYDSDKRALILLSAS